MHYILMENFPRLFFSYFLNPAFYFIFEVIIYETLKNDIGMQMKLVGSTEAYLKGCFYAQIAYGFRAIEIDVYKV
jgi:hypothetical protein